ncbi:MAG: ATP-binding cassette domain-containing protein [Nitrospirae bacterium]|nr:ATP-binding cassette domain-containing protein [Nitrospirota bacterium]
MGLRLVISDISKSYNGRPVLKGCSFSFGEDSIYALTGANGSGKSTFLRICALLEAQDKGEVNYFSGVDALNKDIKLRRSITLVLPKIGVFNASVFKNVSYGLRIRGMRSREIEERVDTTLKFVGLSHKRSQNALTLSSGETQRLGIARAVVIEPEMLFLDEPTASVDEENTEIIENIILTLKRQGKTAIVIATHDMAQAERLQSRILTLRQGKII